MIVDSGTVSAVAHIYAREAVPKIVPSGRLDALSCKLGRSAEPRIFTSESQRIQNALKC